MSLAKGFCKRAQLKQLRVMSVPYDSYRFALHADGSCCAFVLIDENEFSNLPFPPTFPFDNSTVIGAATYHPQNVALLQWFAFERTPDSLGGAYSYPDPSVLPRR